MAVGIVGKSFIKITPSKSKSHYDGHWTIRHNVKKVYRCESHTLLKFEYHLYEGNKFIATGAISKKKKQNKTEYM